MIPLLGVALAGGAYWWVRSSSPVPPEPPRQVLLITVDTLRADALGAYGRRQALTPTLDRLAAGGVRFDRARAHNVVTLPSHANILSGRYPFEHGIRDNGGFRFPASQPTLATILKARGYRTAAFVSAFPLDSRFGLDRGFDVYDDEFVGAGTQQPFLVQERAGQETVTRARRWLDAQGDAPAFCWIHLYEPHFPYAPPDTLRSRFSSSPYDGEVAAADMALRPLLEPILDRADRGNTLVVLTSDHGESLGEHGEAAHGIFAYEASLRVPLIVYEPRAWKPAVVSAPVRHIDLLPTILQALGIPAPPGLTGRSLVDYLAGRAMAPVPTYFEAMSGTLTRGWAPLTGLVRDEVKFIDLPLPEVYALDHDPGEARNRADDERDLVQELRSELERLAQGAPAADARSETADTRARLRSLGYLGGPSSLRKTAHTEADDPKRLIALDSLLQDVVGRYLDGDLAGALERCRELVRQRPQMAVSLLHLAHLEREAGHLDAALAALDKAADLNGDDEETLALLGAYLTEAGRAREAVDRLKAVAEKESPDINLLAAYALALARTGATDEAVAALTRAQRIDPSHAMLHVHQGTVHLIANDRVRARQEFEAALSLAPDVARAHSSLGVLAAEDGRMDEATAHWDRAVAKDPREFRTILGMGLSLSQRGRAAEARPFLEYVITNAPESMFPAERRAAARLLGAVR